MTTVNNSISTPVRQSSTLSSALSGSSDSTSGQTISDFSSLLAALFAAPQVVVANQIPVPANSLAIGTQQQSNSQNSNPNSGSNTSQTNVVDSLSSLLFANSLANQASTTSTNGLTTAASILGQTSSNTLNPAVASTPSLSTSGVTSAAILGQTAIASAVGTDTAASVLGALSAQTATATNSAATTAQALLNSITAQSTNISTTATATQTNNSSASSVLSSLAAPAANSNTSPTTVNANQIAQSSNQTANQPATNLTRSDLSAFSTNSQTTNVSGVFSSSNQTSPLFSKTSVKVPAKPTTLADSVKAALAIANSNLDAVAASLVLQLSPTPVIANTNASSTPASDSTLLNTTAITSATTQQATPANSNTNLSTAELAANSTFFRLSSTTSATTNSTSATTSNPPSGTVSVVVTPGLSTSSATAANLAVTNTTDSLAISQSTNVLSSPILTNGRTPGQSVILPTLPQSPLVPAAGADAYPNGFYSVTGIDRPADAVSTLDGLKPIDTTAGGNALFAREHSDIADLNSLLRGQEPKLATDNSTVASNGNTFAKQVEVASNPATPAPADQPSKVLTQIADAVAERAQVIREKGSTEIRMRLDPPDLGTIDIRVHSHKGELRADITAADPAVRTMIESQLSDLRSALEKSGLDFQSFNLNSGNRSDRGGQQPDNPGSSAGFDRKTPSVAPVVVTPSAVVTPNRGALLDVTA